MSALRYEELRELPSHVSWRVDVQDGKHAAGPFALQDGAEVVKFRMCKSNRSY